MNQPRGALLVLSISVDEQRPMPRNPSESSEVRGMEELVGVKPVVGVTSCS